MKSEGQRDPALVRARFIVFWTLVAGGAFLVLFLFRNSVWSWGFSFPAIVGSVALFGGAMIFHFLPEPAAAREAKTRIAAAEARLRGSVLVAIYLTSTLPQEAVTAPRADKSARS